MDNKAALIALVLLIFLVPGTSVFAQRSKPRPKATPEDILPLEPQKNWPFEPVISDFAFVVDVDRNGQAKVGIQVNERSTDISSLELNAIYERFLTRELYPSLDNQGPFNPVIIIRPAPDLTYAKLIKYVEPLRKFGPNRIKIDVGESRYVVVPARVKDEVVHDVKPDPLRLVVDLNVDSKISLNRDEFGTSRDLGPVSRELRRVFKDREDHGVFREGTYSIEKTVALRINEAIKFEEVLRLSTAVGSAGSDQIWLELEPDVVLMEPILLPPIPDSLLDSTPIPRPPKKKRSPK